MLTTFIQVVTGETVEIALSQGYSGDEASRAAARSLGGEAQFRLGRDYKRLPDSLKALHFLDFAILMVQRFVQGMAFCL